MRQLNENYSNSNDIAVLGTANPSEMGKIFSYNGNNVTMRVQNGTVYVNLTEFARPVPSKNLTQIINSQEIREYCNSLSKLQNYSFADLLIVRKGSPELGGGTWAHQKVALRVAQKLSPDFAVWVDTKIEELLTTGVTTVSNDDEAIAYAMSVLQKRLEQAKAEKELLAKQNAKLQPKADFADAAFATDDKVDIGMAAKILKLGFGRNTLFQKLRQAGVFFSNRNEPKQRFVNAGYFEMKEKFIERDNHPGFVVTKTLVTQKGLAYINHLFGGNPSDGKLTPIR